MRSRDLHIWFLLFCIPHMLLSQASNHGLPFCSNYDKVDYRGGSQNHDFAQDSRGRMYVANNDGLLMFNGNQWLVNPLPNHTIVRSVEIATSGNIVAGGQDELGIFYPDSTGELRYESLIPRLPEDFKGFEDVWSIEVEQDTIWFMGHHHLGKITPNGFKGFRPERSYDQFEIIEGQKYLFEQGKGLLKYDGHQFILIPGTDRLKEEAVTGIVKGPKGLWVATVKAGIWEVEGGTCEPLTGESQNHLIEFRAQTIISLSENRYAVGTSSEGILILNKDAEPLNWLHKGNSIRSNYILSLFEDQEKNLWTGLENGIGHIELCSPFRQIIVDPEQESAGYSMSGTESSWWFGTSTGLYRIPAESYTDPLISPTRLRPVTDGQVWGLRHIDEELFIAHHEGGFTGENTLRRFSSETGFWWYVPVPGYQDLVAAGTYSGIFLLEKQNGNWGVLKKVEGLQESCRLLATDQERIWMAHPYRGIFSIDFSEGLDDIEVKRYGQENGLPDDLYNHVFTLFGGVYFGTIQGVYRFDEESDSFSRDEEIMTAIGVDGWVKIMREDQNGFIWFVMEEGVGYLKVDDSGLKRSISCHWLPEVDSRIVKGHEFVYPYDDRHVFFGTDNGFLRFDPEMANCTSSEPKVVFSGVWAQGRSDSLLLSAYTRAIDLQQYQPEFHHGLQNFRFEFASTSFRQADRPSFRYYLEGMDSDWSNWSTSTEKEYTQLSPGTYSFHVQARNSRKTLSQPVTFSFVILPPWYASQTARIIYFLLGILLLAGILLIPRRRFQEEKQKLESDLKLQKEESAKQVNLLKNQTLQAEITHKNQELATATMHLVQKNELLNRLKSELEKLKDKVKDPNAKSTIRALARQMSQEERFDKDWEQFAYHFDQVHSDFLKRLQEKYPQLTPKDHRLCAYLRMNLSSKEIAPMMNISVRGVEIGRYRLRKKLDLAKEQNLNDFMMRF